MLHVKTVSYPCSCVSHVRTWLCVCRRGLLVHDPLNQSMDSAMFSLALSQGSRPTSAGGTRPSLRICEGSYRQSLQGGGLQCIAEVSARTRRTCYRPHMNGRTSCFTRASCSERIRTGMLHEFFYQVSAVC